MQFYYIRHGDPIYSPDSLTELGARQAEAVGRRLAPLGIEKVYASSSTRAILTGTPLFEMIKKEPEILDWANEKHAWRELTTPTKDGKNVTWLFYPTGGMRPLLHSEEMASYGFRWYDHPAFAGRNYEKGFTRIVTHTRELFASLGYEFDEARGAYRVTEPPYKRVALFAHQGFGIAFLSVVLNIPYPAFSTRFDMSHSGVTVIDFREEGDGFAIPCATALADDGHLYAERLATRYQNGTQI